jgi:hypothetical protein
MPRKKTPNRARKRKKAPAARRMPKAPPINPRGLKFGPAVRGSVLEALGLGATQKLAAELAGIDPRTLKSWLARGRENLGLIAEWEAAGEVGPMPELDRFGRFALEVGQARAKADMKLVGHVTEAAEAGEWRAALALLARRRPAEFGDHLAVTPATIDDDGQRQDVTAELLNKLTLAAQRMRGEAPDASG